MGDEERVESIVRNYMSRSKMVLFHKRKKEKKTVTFLLKMHVIYIYHF